MVTLLWEHRSQAQLPGRQVAVGGPGAPALSLEWTPGIRGKQSRSSLKGNATANPCPREPQTVRPSRELWNQLSTHEAKSALTGSPRTVGTAAARFRVQDHRGVTWGPG